MKEELKLIDETFEIEFKGLLPDFKFMYELIKWCDTYTRFGLLKFEINKDFVHYSLYLERNKDLVEYIKKVKVYIRKPLHRLKYEDKKIREFKLWILLKFKEDFPKFNKWEIFRKQGIKRGEK